MKLSCKQLDQAQENPKEIAKMLLTTVAIKGGFNKVTHEVCYALAKGHFSYEEAKDWLEIRLSEEFKDNPRNRKRRKKCQEVLDSFFQFLEEEGLRCVQNYSRMNIDLTAGHSIGGHGCAIFKNMNGQYRGVIITDREFDFSRSLRIPIEQYWISKKMQLEDSDSVEIYVYNAQEHSYQCIMYSLDKIRYVLSRSYEVIKMVDAEMKKIG